MGGPMGRPHRPHPIQALVGAGVAARPRHPDQVRALSCHLNQAPARRQKPYQLSTRSRNPEKVLSRRSEPVHAPRPTVMPPTPNVCARRVRLAVAAGG